MPKSRKQKEEAVQRLVDKINSSKSLVLSNYQGMTVAEVQELKKRMIEQEGSFNVVKNALLKIALKESEIEGADFTDYAGPIAVTFAKDEVSGAKETHNFAKECKTIEIREGFLDGKVLSKEAVESLALLPSKEELIAMTVGTIKAPVTSFVNVLGANIRGLVVALKAISEQKS
ncbi:50S ribosomal protein L10 [Patescibacteria group bacterium]|nr:50S ribosomal protein L10 [Patescibacteria group bacterium]